MTTSEILNLYGITFSNRILKIAEFPAEIDKHADVTNGSLFRFLIDWNSVQDIEEDLLPEIDAVLNGINESANTEREVDWVELNVNTTKFYIIGSGSYPDNPSFQMSTSDFKVVIEAWRDFLLKPPFHGSPASISDNKLIVL